MRLAPVTALVTVLVTAMWAVVRAPAVAADVDKQSYCVNGAAEFYPYVDGQVCRKGYQIAGGNCRLKDARVIAVSKAECTRLEGDVVLPLPAARITGDGDPKQPATAKPLTVTNPKN